MRDTPKSLNEELMKMRKLMNFDISENSHDVLSENFVKNANRIDEQDKGNKNSSMLNWLSTNKSGFMGNLKKMGFNPGGFATSQLAGMKDTTLAGVSTINYVTDDKLFNTLTGEPTKLMTNNPKQLVSSVSTDGILVTPENRVKLDGGVFAPPSSNYYNAQQRDGHRQFQGYVGDDIETICKQTNKGNVAQFRMGNAQVIKIVPVQGENYNEVVIGKSKNLHLFSTKEVVTKTISGTTGKDGETIIGPNFDAFNLDGSAFRPNSDQLSNADDIRSDIQDRITEIIEAEMTIEQIGTIQINSSTDSMQTSRNGGNPQLAQDRANTLVNILTTQINPPIPENQINITTAPNTIPPGQVNWQTAKAAGVNKLTWQRNNAPARMVSISFPEAKGPDIDIKPVKATPPRDVDVPKTVYINHLQVYIKK